MTTSAAARPQAVTWYRIYAIFVAVFYILILLLGIGLLAFDPSTLGITAEDALEMRINAIACVVVGLPFSIIFGIAPFLPSRPWAWVYGIVTICLSLTSCCCLPAAIPLLIFWIKPEVKQFYGFGNQPATPQDSI
ncbi:MAG: hypothetical protein HC838_16105 [Spirulinaceae cyanobacterium RM2_2_10]|nr:hypothetical protein [Spirulinaceae cyanobacterium RM2_2_10]